MLICSICHDTSTRSSSCVLCKNDVDIKCQGGTVGNGYIICKTCSGILIRLFYSVCANVIFKL